MKQAYQLQILALVSSGTATLNIPGPGVLIGLVIQGSASANASAAGTAVAIFSVTINTTTGVLASGVQGTQVLGALMLALPQTTASNTVNAALSQQLPINRRVLTGDQITFSAAWTGTQPQVAGVVLVSFIPD